MRLILTGVRSVATWLLGIIATIVCGTTAIVIALINDTSPLIERVIWSWSRVWLVASGTRLTIEGQEHIEKDRSYMVVANHLSTLDIMACFLAVRLPIRYLAKKELFRVPLLAQAMRAVGIIEVDREARSAVHSLVNKQAKELLLKKRSLIIYAEGTRPRDGVMKRFKKGAFTMAISSNLPILPLSIHGTYEAMPPGTTIVRGGPVSVVIDPPIETTDLTHADANRLRDEVQSIISGRVAAMGGRVGV